MLANRLRMTSGKKDIWMMISKNYSDNSITVLTSVDGITWNEVSSFASTSMPSQLAYGQNIWVLALYSDSEHSAGFYYSTDNGVTWTFYGDGTSSYGSTGVAFSGSRLLVTSPYRTWNSLNGTTWAKANFGLSGVSIEFLESAVTYVPEDGLFYSAVPTGIKSTPDGVNPWTDVKTGFSNYAHGIAYGNGVYVVIEAGGRIWSSLDGVAGTYTLRHTAPYWLNKVIFANGLFVVVSDNSYVYTSSDGITWTQRNTLIYNNIHDIYYAKGQFIAVGEGVDNKVQFSKSTNGITWTATTLTTDGVGRAIAYNGD
jgi:hypothetical protein